MPRHSLAEDIALSSSLDILVTAYQKVSVGRMQNTRRQVLSARKFTEELTATYADIRSSSQLDTLRRQLRGLLFSRQVKQASYHQSSLAIMFSSNNRLDGGISQQVFRLFSPYVEQKHCAVIITGRVGINLFKRKFPHRQYNYIPLPHQKITERDLAPLVEHTKKYSAVKIFYGKFISFIQQKPAVATLAEATKLPDTNSKKLFATPSTKSYIYEPSLAAVIASFDTQILTSLLTRTAQESNLAEHGSRVTTMEQARHNVGALLKKLNREIRYNRKEAKNKRQREQLASLQLWLDKPASLT